MNIIGKNTADNADVIAKAIETVRNSFSYGISGNSEEEIEASKKEMEAKIMRKLEAGKELSTKELNFLRRNNPALYAKAMRAKIKRQAVEHRLENAKSKEEVADIYGEAITSIDKDDSARKYIIAAVEDAVKEFKETQYYKKLPAKKSDERKQCVKSCEDFCKDRDMDEIVYETKLGGYQEAYITK